MGTSAGAIAATALSAGVEPGKAHNGFEIFAMVAGDRYAALRGRLTAC